MPPLLFLDCKPSAYDTSHKENVTQAKSYQIIFSGQKIVQTIAMLLVN